MNTPSRKRLRGLGMVHAGVLMLASGLVRTSAQREGSDSAISRKYLFSIGVGRIAVFRTSNQALSS